VEPKESKQRNKKALASVVVLVAIVVLVIGATALANKKSGADTVALSGSGNSTEASGNSGATLGESTGADTESGTSTSGSSSSGTTPSGSTSLSSYKDGTYSATGSYNSPGGQESIAVSVTLKGDTVVDSTVESEADDPTAAQFQADFISGYKSLVVGKNINSIRLSRVSGSSLTSKGFNNALEQIKSQAQS